jgi:hypothetical protein
VILSVRKNQLHELERGPYHEVSTSTATPRQGCLPLCALRALLGAGGIWRLNSPDFGHRKESTGAVVPAARVTAVERQTGIKQATRTNTQGFYSFPSPPLAIRSRGVRQLLRGIQADGHDPGGEHGAAGGCSARTRVVPAKRRLDSVLSGESGIPRG